MIILITHTSKRVKHHKLFVVGFWLISTSWQIRKGLDLEPSPPNHVKFFLKILSITISISWPSFMSKWYTTRRRYLKKYTNSCANVHHDVLTFEYNEMVLKKSQTSQVWNVNFMSKEKTLYLCLNDYIFKLYHFLVKVNFNPIDKIVLH